LDLLTEHKIICHHCCLSYVLLASPKACIYFCRHRDVSNSCITTKLKRIKAARFTGAKKDPPAFD